jgi:hypothetical protein
MATETYKIIAQSNPSATTLTDIYTVGVGNQAVISSIIVTNRGTSSVKYRIALAVNGAANDPKQYIAYDESIGANEVFEFTIGATLGAGDVIRVYTATANLSFNVFGTEITP